MVSTMHESFVRLLRENPTLVVELLREALGSALPTFTEVRTDSADFTKIKAAEFRADLFLRLLVDGRTVFTIVVEVQLETEARKRFVWPVYGTEAYARFECPSIVLVVTPYANVATWARQPVDIGAGFVFRPTVLGPDGVPAIEDFDAAERAPD